MVVRRVSELGELSEAEQQVLAELDSGEDVVLGDGSVPEASDDGRRVRAALIRLLLLGEIPTRSTACTRRGSGSRGRGSGSPRPRGLP